MLSCCTGHLAEMPDIIVYMNCDTRLAINLKVFELSEYDEFIFVIKNYDYQDSSYAFLFRACKDDIDERGEVIFNIDPDASKNIKPGAFYNFALLVNAFNKNIPTEYRKLTKNGKVIIEYGAHDMALPEANEDTKSPFSKFNDIIGARLEATNEDGNSVVRGVIAGIDFEDLT